MDEKAASSLFPPPQTPTNPISTPRSRRPKDTRRRSTSLDPLPPIEEPPHPPPPVSASPRSESPGLKSIHSLYNPRPSSRRATSDKQRPSSQHQSSFPVPVPATDESLAASRRSSLNYPPAHPPPLPPPPPFEHERQSPGISTSQEMHVPSPSTASSLSLQKPPILPPSPALPAKNPKPSQPRVAYFHGGIGGRGNYRKVVRENNRAPLAHARNVSPIGGRSSRFLSNLFGGAKRRRASPNGEAGDGNAAVRNSEDSFGSSEKEEVELGAAEVMRRKLLRQAGVKPKSSRGSNMDAS